MLLDEQILIAIGTPVVLLLLSISLLKRGISISKLVSPISVNIYSLIDIVLVALFLATGILVFLGFILSTTLLLFELLS